MHVVAGSTVGCAVTMAPYTPSVGDGTRDEAMYESTPAISTYVSGHSPDRNSSQEARLENASDVADLKAGLLLSPKHIPCGYLYDDKGSQLYEEITKLEEYYPFNAEKDLLNQHATEIVSSIPAGSILVELGCGTAEKTSVLLHALIARWAHCTSQASCWKSSTFHAFLTTDMH